MERTGDTVVEVNEVPCQLGLDLAGGRHVGTARVELAAPRQRDQAWRGASIGRNRSVRGASRRVIDCRQAQHS